MMDRYCAAVVLPARNHLYLYCIIFYYVVILLAGGDAPRSSTAILRDSKFRVTRLRRDPETIKYYIKRFTYKATQRVLLRSV